VGSEPGSSQFNLFSHFFTTLPLSHSGSPINSAKMFRFRSNIKKIVISTYRPFGMVEFNCPQSTADCHLKGRLGIIKLTPDLSRKKEGSKTCVAIVGPSSDSLGSVSGAEREGR
jgi:hypothetical protein